MKSPVPMEMLSLSDGQGQNYGFTLYRSSITKGSTLKFTKPIQDRVVVSFFFISFFLIICRPRNLSIKFHTNKLECSIVYYIEGSQVIIKKMFF